jgi:hypothetical protein
MRRVLNYVNMLELLISFSTNYYNIEVLNILIVYSRKNKGAH